jgi:hypothetical protein
MRNRNKLALAFFGALTVIVGCSTEADDAASSGGQAQQLAESDDDEFDVEDRMGRPEMTNVTIGAGLVRLKLLKDALTKTTDKAQQAAIGAELQTLAVELGTPQSAGLKSELANANVITPRVQQATDDAKAFAARVEAALTAKAKGEKRDLTSAEKAQIADAKSAAEHVRRVPAYFKAYNKQHVFHPQPGERQDAMNLLGAGIRADDTLAITAEGPADAKDWSEDDLKKILPILAEDALIVDISKPCDIDSQSFFSIERDMLSDDLGVGKSASSSCGGRTLQDDIIDDILTMWVHKSFDFGPNNARRVTDNVIAVNANDVGKTGGLTLPNGDPVPGIKINLSPTTSTFPYLGDPRDVPFVGAGSLSPPLKPLSQAAAAPAGDKTSK